MSDQYMKELLRVAVAQICQTIGYNATQTAPLELLQDVMDKFMREFTRDLRRHVEHYNRTEANLNDVTLTLNSINVNLTELLDYINNVEPVPFAVEVPEFPARKNSALNFLKPGSKEVLTRPVHVHDHLPPMLPPEMTQAVETPLSISCINFNDTNENLTSHINNANTDNNGDTSNKTINATTVLDKTTLKSLFKSTNNYDDGERPTREVSSVVMTTGGYISPAVEGKMPEAIVPDIIDKLLGFDAPPPPPPPLPPTVLQSRPASRSATSTPTPIACETLTSAEEKYIPDREGIPSTVKDGKKTLTRSVEPQPILNKKLDIIQDFKAKKNKSFNHVSGKGYTNDPHLQPSINYNKKSFVMHQNAANMLLKKAKKQKVPIAPGQSGINEKHQKPLNDKVNKIDAAGKAHRKYMKMLQKMAKQGKIPPEVLSNIMGPDKKSKIINPCIVAGMPPGPEKLQLEKLLRKQAKQQQKLIKQQMTESQKQSKKPLQQVPPLVPIFPARVVEPVNKPLTLQLEEQKFKIENNDYHNILPTKSAFSPNVLTTTSASNNLPDVLLPKINKAPAMGETNLVDIDPTAKSLITQDAKELKLSNEPDRSKLNIFKKISKQKNPKPSSPTPMRVPGLCDNPIINLPSGTTITPALGLSHPPGSSTSLTPVSAGRNLFPSLPENNNSGNMASNIISIGGIKDKPVAPPISINQPTDLSMLNRVFGENPTEVELVNKPKKRGRKPGSKNSPKIPGALPNNILKKNAKKIKLDNSNIFAPQIPPHLPPEFSAANMGNLSFDNVAQLFGNSINPMEWSQNKHLQQQMMIMANAKERKEHKKKNKIPKQELLNHDKIMPNVTNPHIAALPTNEEVQSINKKLMRMDTILKAAPLPGPSDLTIDTSLITGKKLPTPSAFPSSTSPLKSPGTTKRILSAGAEVMTNSLMQPFMLPHRPPFPNLPTNMLSMLQFPFQTRPGLIPTPGLFPTPGLGAFPNNSKNSLLPGLFPFPNLKHNLADNTSINQESEDLTSDKKKLEANLQTNERSYCNVAPLVPDFLTKLNEQIPNKNAASNKHFHDALHTNESNLPKTPKPRSLHSSTLSQDNLLKKIADVHTPESASGSSSGKSIPSTPGGISVNTFEQLMKKCDSPMDLISFNKHTKSLSGSQESGLDFSISKKPAHNTNAGNKSSALAIKTPFTLNNEPIEVSDDSDETNEHQPPKPDKRQTHTSTVLSQQQQHPTHILSNFNMDDMFVANAGINLLHKSGETDLSTKELKKLKKQVKKPSSSVNIINTDITEVRTMAPCPTKGVGKLAGGADLIPLTSTGMAYSSKNIPYNSLTANANPSFHSHKTEFTTTPTGPPTIMSAHPSTSVFDNLTITAAIPMPSTNSNTVFDLQKKRKEHKKLKKLKELKEGKIKKKKDKKDKSKTKEKTDKYLVSHTQASLPKEKEPLTVIQPPANMAPGIVPPNSSGSSSEKSKEKDLVKKLKKDKKKEKQRTCLEDQAPQNAIPTPQASFSNSSAHKDTNSTTSITKINALECEQPKKQKLSPPRNYTTSAINDHNVTSLTINTANPTVTSIVPKLTLKLGSMHSPTPPREEGLKNSNTTATVSPLANVIPVQTQPNLSSPVREREPSPELARISPLVTRPPKHKLINSTGDTAGGPSVTNSVATANAISLEIGESNKSASISNSNMIVPPPSPWLSGGTISASSVLLPHQLLQTTKQHDTIPSSTSTVHNTESTSKNINADRQSPLTLITEKSRPCSYIDADGNRVWICPACGKVDDGSPMIGCDICDAWYHWICVGIVEAPNDNEDWFCRVCITRKKGLHGSDKKRKRNKKK